MFGNKVEEPNNEIDKIKKAPKKGGCQATYVAWHLL